MYNNKYRLSYLPLFYRDLEVRRFLYNGQNKEKIL